MKKPHTKKRLPDSKLIENIYSILQVIAYIEFSIAMGCSLVNEFEAVLLHSIIGTIAYAIIIISSMIITLIEVKQNKQYNSK